MRRANVRPSAVIGTHRAAQAYGAQTPALAELRRGATQSGTGANDTGEARCPARYLRASAGSALRPGVAAPASAG